MKPAQCYFKLYTYHIADFSARLAECCARYDLSVIKCRNGWYCGDRDAFVLLHLLGWAYGARSTKPDAA